MYWEPDKVVKNTIFLPQGIGKSHFPGFVSEKVHPGLFHYPVDPHGIFLGVISSFDSAGKQTHGKGSYPKQASTPSSMSIHPRFPVRMI
uniref:Uncharacterized protein n=1 Tax=Candidatus Kentrum sp. TC TaxID=2126339 RepID=A0A450YTY6_9GAMM|nr:MAG: hypothetical protein BECKTC1821D_GA0114238_102324 [Candidatus Kentron sp. TC]